VLQSNKHYVKSFLRNFTLSHYKPIKKYNNDIFLKKKQSLHYVEFEQAMQSVIVELQLLHV